MKHEGDMPVTIKCTVVFSGDTGYQEKDQRVCLHVNRQLSAPISYLYHLAIWKMIEYNNRHIFMYDISVFIYITGSIPLLVSYYFLMVPST